jgi:hypothetical protein
MYIIFMLYSYPLYCAIYIIIIHVHVDCDSSPTHPTPLKILIAQCIDCYVTPPTNKKTHDENYNIIIIFQYCHYVAGLVGIGLSRLFSASELESSEVGEDHQLANSMGLFLQKTNIIRDYLEDVLQGREFWPKEVQETLPM